MEVKGSVDCSDESNYRSTKSPDNRVTLQCRENKLDGPTGWEGSRRPQGLAREPSLSGFHVSVHCWLAATGTGGIRPAAETRLLQKVPPTVNLGHAQQAHKLRVPHVQIAFSAEFSGGGGGVAGALHDAGVT